MPVTLYQADGVLVPPVADARLYEMLSGGAVGIVQGCEITSLGGNQLQITSGWGVCLGRVFSIDQETISATTSSGGEVTGRLLLAIDVSNGATPIAFVTQAQTSLPALVQEDINLDGNIYQIPLATYNIGELSISDLRTVYPTANVSGVGLYTHSKSGTVHEFTGTGANGRAKMTADVQVGDTFTVNGTPVTAYMGADNATDAMAGSQWNGKWVSFIVEEGALNFKGASGGLKPGQLAFVSALEGMNKNTYKTFDTPYFSGKVCQRKCRLTFFTAAGYNVNNVGSGFNYKYGVNINGVTVSSVLASVAGTDNLVYDLGTFDIEQGDTVEALIVSVGAVNQRGGAIIGVLA